MAWSKKIQNLIHEHDQFSKAVSLYATDENTSETNQYHGSLFGLVLTVLGYFVALSFMGLLMNRMVTYKDDTFSSQIMSNNFYDHDQLNEFYMNDFHFLPSYEIYTQRKDMD